MKILSPQELQHWRGRLVDVREPQEFAAERLAVPTLESAPLGRLAEAAARWDRTAPVLVLCKSGQRSRQAATDLERLGFQNVATLDGGLQACRAAGLPIVGGGRAPLPIIRQVMIAAGALLLGGLALAHAVPLFIALTWFVAAGLLFAGLTGYCPMARLLEWMPWNRTPACPGCAGEKAGAA